MNPRPAFEVPHLACGRHPHLEQEQAEHALEGRDEELVVVGDFVSLEPADEADDDAAEEETEPGVEEDLPAATDRRTRPSWPPPRAVRPGAAPFAPRELHPARFRARFAVEAWPGAGLGRGAGAEPRRHRRDVPGLIGHVPGRVHAPMAQPRHQIQRHQAPGDLHDGQHDRHVGVESHVRRPASTPTQVANVPAESDP